MQHPQIERQHAYDEQIEENPEDEQLEPAMAYFSSVVQFDWEASQTRNFCGADSQ
jgi:hypothetical protein